MMKPDSLLGKYRIICPIGTGGFATVYLGEHVYLRTRAAIKVLRAGLNLEGDSIKEFLNEARIIAALRHPHIISILDFDVQKRIPYLVMEYAPNGSLGTRYNKGQILQPKIVLTYVRQISSALQFAHDHKVIHCDIKPENMLLDDNDSILLSDFGISVVLNTSLKMNKIVGTLQYMAPEQFLGKPEPASDQYALAIVIYQWLCGRLPFCGKNIFELSHLHMKVPPLPLRQLNARVPRKVELVILTALSKDPRQRFTSISAFARAFEEAAYLPQSVEKTGTYLPAPTALLKKPTPLDKKETSVPSETPMLLPPSFSLLPPADEEKTLISPLLHVVSNAQSVESTQEETQKSQEAAQVTIVPKEEHTVELTSQRPSKPKISSTDLACLTYNGHTGWVSAIAWSPDGRLIASGSWDKTVHLWNVSSGQTVLVYKGHTQPVKSVSWSPDGGYIASGSWDNGVQIWDITEGKALPGEYHHNAQIESVAWSPDGRCIVSAGQDGTVQVWRAMNKRTLSIYKGHAGPVWSAIWSPDGKSIASASHDGTVHIWEAYTGASELIYRAHQCEVTAVSWCYNGQLIASGDHDGNVHIWKGFDRSILLHYHDNAGAVKALNWAPHSLHFASAVKSVQVWNITTHVPNVPDFTYTQHTNWINALQWSPDSQTIATASDDKTVQLWKADRSSTLL